MNFWQIQKALVWKHFLIKKRHPVKAAFELLLPVVICSLLVLLPVYSRPVLKRPESTDWANKIFTDYRFGTNNFERGDQPDAPMAAFFADQSRQTSLAEFLPSLLSIRLPDDDTYRSQIIYDAEKSPACTVIADFFNDVVNRPLNDHNIMMPLCIDTDADKLEQCQQLLTKYIRSYPSNFAPIGDEQAAEIDKTSVISGLRCHEKAGKIHLSSIDSIGIDESYHPFPSSFIPGLINDQKAYRSNAGYFTKGFSQFEETLLASLISQYQGDPTKKLALEKLSPREQWFLFSASQNSPDSAACTLCMMDDAPKVLPQSVINEICLDYGYTVPRAPYIYQHIETGVVVSLPCNMYMPIPGFQMIGRNSSIKNPSESSLLVERKLGELELNGGSKASWLASEEFDIRQRNLRESFDRLAEVVLSEFRVYRIRELPLPQSDWKISEYQLAFGIYASGIIPFLLLLSSSYTIFKLSQLIFEDKSIKLKEYLKVFGVNSLNYFISYYLFFVPFNLISNAIVCALLSAVFPHFDHSITFVFLALFNFLMISYCVLYSALTNNPNVGAFTSTSLFIFLELVGEITKNMFILKKDLTLASCLLPAPLFLQFFSSVVLAGAVGYPTQQKFSWSNIGSGFQSVPVAQVFGFLILDICLYFFIGLYLHAVFPGEFGIPRPWYFPFTLSFWHDVFGIFDKRQPQLMKEISQNLPEVCEPYRGNKPKIISAENVEKVFDNGVHAVKGITLDVHEGEIFALLGHNGAGKTTLISMLIGFLESTVGKLLINGYDIKQQKDLARKYIGYCPQFDLCFPYMTVREHLEMIGRIRGMGKAAYSSQLENLCSTMKLDHRLDYKSSELSGGQRRRLSVGMALMGDVKAILLDEPSTGMDPHTRRALWSILKLIKSDKAIIITTHFMEEADFLGDRVGIMAAGVMKCEGSSMFLKSAYGVGLNLTCTLTDAGADDVPLTKFVMDNNAGSELKARIAQEAVYLLPKSSPGLVTTLRGLEDHKTQGELHLQSFCLSVTTLEEVFLKVGTHAESQIDELTDRENDASATDPFSDAAPYTLTRTPMLAFTRHFVTTFLKRFKITFRDKMSVMCSVVLPILTVCLAVLAASAFFRKGPEGITLSFDGVKAVQGIDNYFPSPVHVGGPASEAVADQIRACDASGIMDISVSNIPTFQEFAESLIPFHGRRKPMLMSFWAEPSPYGGSLDVTIAHNTYVFPQALPLSIYSLLGCTPDGPKFSLKTGYYSPRIEGPFGFETSWLMMALGFIGASWGSLYVREKVCKAKSSQFLKGISMPAYWLGSIVFDSLFYLLIASLLLLVLYITGATSYTIKKDTSALLLLYGFSFAPFCAFLSLLIEAPLKCQFVIILLSTLAPIVPAILVNVKSIKSSYLDYIRYFLGLIPPLMPAEIFREQNNVFKVCADTENPTAGPCEVNYSGMYWFLLINPILYLSLVIGIEYLTISGRFEKTFKAEKEFGTLDEEDVKNEEIRVAQLMNTGNDVENSGDANTDVLLVHKLGKTYGNGLDAVKSVSFGIKKHECFGFLGVNGAGKTTTISMITGDLKASRGTALVNGYSISGQRNQCRKYIGQCPQFDTHLEQLTGREHFQLYGRLSLIDEAYLNGTLIPQAAHLLGIVEYLDRPVKTYSGGNKRKLSVGLALLGNPTIAFLDEPSSGVDPGSRRNLWSVISRTTRISGRGILLTTHSMEEAEALCSRLAIIKAGELVCIGTISHLRQKYGSGYEVEVRFPFIDVTEYDTPDTRRQNSRGRFRRGSSKGSRLEVVEPEEQVTSEYDNITSTMKANIERSIGKHIELLELVGNRARFAVPKDGVSISQVFECLSGYPDMCEDFSVSEATLDSIFVKFGADVNGDEFETIKMDDTEYTQVSTLQEI